MKSSGLNTTSILLLFHGNHLSLSAQVNEVKSNLSQIGFDVETIHKMVAGLVSCYFSQHFQNVVARSEF